MSADFLTFVDHETDATPVKPGADAARAGRNGSLCGWNICQPRWY